MLILCGIYSGEYFITEHAGVDAVSLQIYFRILTPPQVHNFKRNSVLLTKISDWLKHFFHKLVSIHSRIGES